MSDDAPYGLDDPQRSGDEAALRRVRPPAIFLLVVSVLNLLAGLYLMVNGIFIKKSGADVEAQMQKQWEAAKQEDRDAMKKIGINSPHDLVSLGANGCLYYGGLVSLVAVLSLFGSVRMMSLHSYSLAMAAAVLTAIPCTTPCCLLGQIAGLWGFVVLLQPDIRRTFQ